MSTPAQEGHRGDVLVVEDSATSRMQLGLILEKGGYRASFATNGDEALAAVRAVPPDLILLDLILPGMDGYKVARRLRREPGLPYIPIIVVTTMGDMEARLAGLEAGADDFVVKPPDEADLLARIASLLRIKSSQEALLLEKGKIDLLYQVSRELSAELDLDTLLSRILNLTIQATSASRGSIILIGERGEAVRKIAFYQEAAVSIPSDVWNRVLQDGLAGWVIQYHEGVVIHDTAEDPRWITVEGAHESTRSVLATPLIYAGRVFGVLTLTHDELNHFTLDHLDLLSSIATQGAMVIEKARAYQREQQRARQLWLVNEVGRQASSILNPPQLLKQVVQLICQTFDYYYVAVALVEGQDLVFQDWGSGRLPEMVVPPARMPLAQQGITTWVVQNGKPLFVPDVSQEPLYYRLDSLPNTVTELAVPLQTGGETLGILDVQSDRHGQLTEEQVPLLETLASQVAVALRNAQVYDAQRRLADRQSTLYEILRAVGEHLNPEDIVGVAVETVERRIGWPGVAVLLPDDTNRNLVVHAAAGSHRLSVGWSIPVDQGVIGRAFRTGQAQHVPDVSADPDYVIGDAAIRSELAVPLRRGKRVLGVFDAESANLSAFDTEAIQMAESLADAIALSLDNARRTTELSILNEIGQALSSPLGLDELVEVIHQQVNRLFNTTNFYIAIYEEGSDEWETLLEIEEGQRLPPEHYELTSGLTGHIIRSKAPLLFHTAAEVAAFEQQGAVTPLGRPAHSWLGVPLVAMDRVVGAMAIQSYELENLYDEDDLALFSTIAAQAAVAIEKVRLYDAAEAERRKLAAVLASTSDVVVVTDCAGNLLLLNPAAEQALGVAAAAGVGHPLAEAIPNQALRDLFDRGIQGIPPDTAEVPLADKRTLYASISQVENVGYVAVMQDISALKRLDRMKSEFVATVSHDLRNPLAAIQGYADLLIVSLEGANRGFAESIKFTAEEMAGLIGDLLDLGKIEAGMEVVRTPCQLDELVRKAVEAAQFQAQSKQLTVVAELPAQVHPVLGDVGRLRQVLDNLISNAVRYTLAGGHITVRLREDAGNVTVEVQDTGIGIPREALPRLFSKFYRVPGQHVAKVPGTGLGLAIVKSIIELHGGRVWAQSDIGEGSTFGFSLPIQTAEE
jgi:signal transduction histidine kinase/DNA-binding response OmpR family regulator